MVVVKPEVAPTGESSTLRKKVLGFKGFKRSRGEDQIGRVL